MWRTSGYAGSVGLEIAAYIGFVGYWGGHKLDEKFGTAPWLFRVAMVVGVGAAIKALVRVNKAYKKSLRDDESSQGKS